MLNVHSWFSLRYGVNAVERIVDWLEKESGYSSIALTDINCTAGVLGFVREMKRRNKKPVVGIDFRNGIDCCFVGIAKNNAGYENLSRYLSPFLMHKTPIPNAAPQLDDCYFIYPINKAPQILKENEFIGVSVNDLNKLTINPPTHWDRYLILEPMTFFENVEFNTHRLLRAIDENILLSKLKAEQQTNDNERFVTSSELIQRYAQFPELITNTYALLSSCSIDFSFGDDSIPQNKKHYSDSVENDEILLKNLCYNGLYSRYKKIDATIIERIEKELKIIKEKQFLSYFLITWDIISYARSRGYFYVGRGSGANSIVAYLLYITDVDPLELDLYFERFINLYRQNPPDFDMDFSWRDRDDVLRYIFRRYKNAAFICTYNTFQLRSTLRELGKVFGLTPEDIERLAQAEEKAQLQDPNQLLLLRYAERIAGLPSHLSVHAGGILISETPIYHYGATFSTQKDHPVLQSSMLESEDVGLFKFDILSQRGLGKIREALDIIAYNQPNNPPADIRNVAPFKVDPKINHLLRTATALGCFYVESPAMRMLMIKLKTETYLELVAASSIIRPGVSQSGMMREYILRHRDPERRKQANPLLLDIMPDTYGIMVYQEDVIKVAHYYGGLSLAEADVLRRGMSGKFRSRDEFLRVREAFISNCKAAGRPTEEIEAIWLQIESFAGYAFSKGHSASYAVESYQSLYLKAYYPLEYMVATINNFGGFYRTEIYVHEARKLGGQIEAPCIHNSKWETCLKGKIVYLGFQHIMGFEERVGYALLTERNENGPFTHFMQFIERTGITLEQVLLLIRIGAFRVFQQPKKLLLWDAYRYFNRKASKRVVTTTLFETDTTQNYSLPPLDEDPREHHFEELELLEFPLCNPFKLIDEKLPRHPTSRYFSRYLNQRIITYGYFVNVKRVRTQRKDVMLFGTLLDIEGQQIDTVHFSETAKNYPFRGRGIYELKGIIRNEFDFYTLELEQLRLIPYCPDPRYYDGAE